ncbi:MAG: cbb3-type cytochrome oxidase assembly protein CcoS [Alphaproteobacteria bacterium]|nr:cbb3-type cytochrome oxidase assembly protein CcoS [Alphaproteobacteria bacterium]MBF0250423.1 cbb3-type cytochrome oxidase assembly protein CcoS [Alphaproteobacteria bacterium]
MDVLIYMIPIALTMGLLALAGFLWSLKSGQFEDMEGAANRILFDDLPVPPKAKEPPRDAGENSSEDSRK